jgi:hypothetical protein
MIKVLTIVAGGLLVVACAPPATRLPSAKLDSLIGDYIGDPSTCVLIADKASGKVIYTYGDHFNCVRALPACDRSGTLSGRQALALAATPGGRGASCPSVADGSRSVGWAEGAIAGSQPPLLYSAVMEGQTALPGIEMNTRLAQVFLDTGLTPGGPRTGLH